MRQRTTFFHHPDDGIEPSSLKIAGRSLLGPHIHAVREDRLTFDLGELPLDLRDLLWKSNELFIRWASPFAYDPLGPWVSRLPPGLHVFYTPRSDDANVDKIPLCDALRLAFGPADCSSLREAFTELKATTDVRPAAFQYYLPLDNLNHFARYVTRAECNPEDNKCRLRVQQLTTAVSFDFAYDPAADNVKASAVWPHAHQALSIVGHPSHRVEVGIMTSDNPPHLQPHELGVTGLLTVLGEDSSPAPTLFTFPARHKSAGSYFSAAFLQPTGMHPTLQLRIDSNQQPAHDDVCTLHAYFTLPKTIFADRYQLDDELFLHSKNLTALRHMSRPVDLEAPDYVIELWGSSALFELRPPPSYGAWTAEIPLHLRYMPPTEGGYQTLEVPHPAVFWACGAGGGAKFANSPFDRSQLGYDALFDSQTIFYHVDPKPSAAEAGKIVAGTPGSGELLRLSNRLTVPVLDLENARHINLGTVVVVALGFAWVVYKLFSGRQVPAEQGGAKSKETKKQQ